MNQQYDPNLSPNQNLQNQPNHFEAPEEPKKSKQPTRRQFLAGTAALGAAVVGGGILYRSTGASRLGQGGIRDIGNGSFSEYTQAGGADDVGNLRGDAVDGRVLIIVELQGGNDSLSTVVPYTSGTYYDSRPDIAIPAAEVLKLNDKLGLHPNLTNLSAQGVTLVTGVGSKLASLSHFDSEKIWQAGDADGKTGYRSGFLARCADTVDNGSPITGVALGGFTPYFNAARAPSISLRDPNQLHFYAANEENKYVTAYQSALRQMNTGSSESLLDVVGTSYDELMDLGVLHGKRAELDYESPMLKDGGELGRQLYLAGDLIQSGLGVRVIHCRMGGYDTHTGQKGRHDNLMAQLDAAVGGFLERANAGGYKDKCLVAMFSEFGRRVAENDSGTDHGLGATIMLAGAINSGIIGEEMNVADQNDRGNLKTKIPFDSLQRSCAEWLGIEGDSIFPKSDTELLF